MSLSITDVGLLISELGLRMQIWVFQLQLMWVFQSVNWVSKCRYGSVDSVNHRYGSFNQ